jgi:Predicted hydrolases of the HAD superfamily
MKQRRKIIAVDFDGTLFTDEYPEVGYPIWSVINYCKEQKDKGAILILWTCRNGEDLTEAVELAKSVGIDFDYVNENTRENLAMYGGRDNRKIYADEYIDDRARSLRDFI